MKKIIFILLVLPLWATAQSHDQGQVLYKEILKLNIELPEEHQQFAAMLPSSQTTEMQLLFNTEASLYRTFEKDEEDMEEEVGNANVQIKMVVASSDQQIYREREGSEKIEKRDFMGKAFLIKGEAKKMPWKLTGKTSELLGYSCQQAIIQDTAQQIVAWFAPKIPVALGPDGYSDLPGLILKMEFGKEGERIIEATNIELKEVDADLIKAPRKGKKVTEEEYERIVEEKTQEMEAGAGNRVIRMSIRNE